MGIAGDMNFRCEIYPDADDKDMGGRDFQAVEEIILTEASQRKHVDNEELRNLFCTSDRLKLYLETLRQRNNESNQTILSNSVDLFDDKCFSPVIRNPLFPYPLPTFTYVIDGITYPRIYGKKRTPSWTDRILVDKHIHAKVCSLGVHDDVLISDHIPVHCLLQIKKLKRML